MEWETRFYVDELSQGSKMGGAMEYKIKPRYGCEVYIGQEGHICILQESSIMGGGDDATIVLAPDEARDLICILQRVLQDLESEKSDD